jgi:hypothetical protein
MRGRRDLWKENPSRYTTNIFDDYPHSTRLPSAYGFRSGGMVFALVESHSLVLLSFGVPMSFFRAVEAKKWLESIITFVVIHRGVFGLLNKFMRGVGSPSPSFPFLSRQMFCASDRHHCRLMVGPVTSVMYSQWFHGSSIAEEVHHRARFTTLQRFCRSETPIFSFNFFIFWYYECSYKAWIFLDV